MATLSAPPPVDDVEDGPQFDPGEDGASSQPVEIPESQPDPNEIESMDVRVFDVQLKLSQDEKDEIVKFLIQNLPKMRPPDREREKIMGYFAMYDMAPRMRNYPYEGAPSLASTDAHDKTNEWLDVAELAFLTPKTTFTIDREETQFTEDQVGRIERTFHRKFFQKVLGEDIRPILFEASYLGASVLAVRENYEMRPIREKFVIKDTYDVQANAINLTKAEEKKAMDLISKGKIYSGEKDALQVVNIGACVNRIDQTKFWFPRNTKMMKEWKIVSEQEFYTKSALLAMAEKGEFDKAAVDLCIQTRKTLYETNDEKQSEPKVPEGVKSCTELDSSWFSEMGQIKQEGDSYEDEFAVYRATLRYGVSTGKDPKGRLRPWIQVAFCPAANCILAATFCQDGFPYYLVQYRPVPYRAMGHGIAQERYNHNVLDTECKSLFLASVEQAVGAPLLIRKNSSLYATAFRGYPSSVAYVDDIEHDVKFLPYPDKTGIAAKGIAESLSYSPSQNQGAGYSSGKRAEVDQRQAEQYKKARIHSIAMDLDKVFNAAWKINCRISQFNRDGNRVIDYVYPDDPRNTKIYILEDEMDPNLVWTSVVTASSLSPDARLQEALQKYEFFHKSEPASVNNPEKTINWQDYMADYFGMDEAQKAKLLLTLKDFGQYQAQLGGMGGDNQEKPSTPAVNQSPATPFSRPAGAKPPGGPPQGAPVAPVAPQPSLAPAQNPPQMPTLLGAPRPR